LLVLLLPPEVVVPVLLVHSVFINMYILFHARKDLQIKRYWPLLVTATLGTPVGLVILTRFDAELLKGLVGIFVMGVSLILISGLTIKIKREKTALFPIGFASGVLNGSTTFSGPPVILFLQNQRVKKDQFRANLVSYFLILNFISIPIFIAFGVLNLENAIVSMKLLPGVLAGVITGVFASRFIPEKPFRYMALAIVFASGALAVGSWLDFF